MGDYGVSNNLAFMRMMWRVAKQKNIITTDESPFKGISISIKAKYEKQHLTYEERQVLIKALDEEVVPQKYKGLLLMFLIGCYTGLRHSDWYQCKSMVNGEIEVYQTKKGGRKKPRQSLIYIPVIPGSQLDQLLMRLPATFKVDNLSSYSDQLPIVMQKVGIKKKITTHCARHSFVVMCLNEAEIDLGMTAELIGDSVETLMKHYAQYVTAGKRRAMTKLVGLCPLPSPPLLFSIFSPVNNVEFLVLCFAR